MAVTLGVALSKLRLAAFWISTMVPRASQRAGRLESSMRAGRAMLGRCFHLEDAGPGRQRLMQWCEYGIACWRELLLQVKDLLKENPRQGGALLAVAMALILILGLIPSTILAFCITCGLPALGWPRRMQFLKQAEGLSSSVEANLQISSPMAAVTTDISPRPTGEEQDYAEPAEEQDSQSPSPASPRQPVVELPVCSSHDSGKPAAESHEVSSTEHPLDDDGTAAPTVPDSGEHEDQSCGVDVQHGVTDVAGTESECRDNQDQSGGDPREAPTNEDAFDQRTLHCSDLDVGQQNVEKVGGDGEGTPPPPIAAVPAVVCEGSNDDARLASGEEGEPAEQQSLERTSVQDEEAEISASPSPPTTTGLPSASEAMAMSMAWVAESWRSFNDQASNFNLSAPSLRLTSRFNASETQEVIEADEESDGSSSESSYILVPPPRRSTAEEERGPADTSARDWIHVGDGAASGSSRRVTPAKKAASPGSMRPRAEGAAKVPAAWREHAKAGRNLFAQSDFHAAIRAYAAAIAAAAAEEDAGHPHLATLYSYRASCHQHLEDWQAVVEDCTMALGFDSSMAKARHRRCAALHQLQHWQEALSDCEALLEVENNDVVRTQLAQRRAALLEQCNS